MSEWIEKPHKDVKIMYMMRLFTYSRHFQSHVVYIASLMSIIIMVAKTNLSMMDIYGNPTSPIEFQFFMKTLLKVE